VMGERDLVLGLLPLELLLCWGGAGRKVAVSIARQSERKRSRTSHGLDPDSHCGHRGRTGKGG
jgi:hypothetical protein